MGLSEGLLSITQVRHSSIKIVVFKAQYSVLPPIFPLFAYPTSLRHGFGPLIPYTSTLFAILGWLISCVPLKSFVLILSNIAAKH